MTNRNGNKSQAPLIMDWDGKSALTACALLKLPVIHEPQGNLSFVEGMRHVPFTIARVYYLYDVPGGEQRGGHAHKSCEEFLIALSGSFDVHVSDGKKELTFHLDRSYYGLYIPKLIWREIDNFTTNSVCLVMASEIFMEEDYYRDYKDYLKASCGASKIDTSPPSPLR